MISSCFNMGYKILNPKLIPVHVRCKGGIGYEVKKSWDNPICSLVTVEVRLCDIDLKAMRVNEDDASTNLDRAILKAIKKDIEIQRKHHAGFEMALSNMNIIVQVPIDQSCIERKNAVHSELLGFTLYLGEQKRTVHPLNTAKDVLDDMETQADNKNSINLGIKLIDPDNSYRVLWTNCFGKAVRVAKVHGDQQPPGLYLFCEGEDINNTHVYYSLEELNDKVLQEYGIFKTEQEALLGGNTEELIKTRKSVEGLRKDNKALSELISTQSVTMRALENKVNVGANEISRLKYSNGQKDSERKFLDLIDKKKQGLDTVSNYVKNASIICSTVLGVYKVCT